MKKISNILFVIVLMFAMCFSVHAATAASDIKILIDGQYLEMDAKPVVVSGRTLVPIRAVVEKLGGKVDWSGEKSQATVTKDDTVILLTLNDNFAIVNGNAVALDVPAQIIESKTMIPLRFVSETLGVKIEFYQNTVIVLTDINADTANSMLIIDGLKDTGKNEKFVVYWGNTGNKVHIDPKCRTIKNGVLSGTLDECKAAGHTEGWCGVCSEDWYDEKFLKEGNPHVKTK